MDENQQTVQEIPVVNRPTRDRLNDRQLVDSEEHKRQHIKWLLHCGKNLEKAEGYARSTVRQVAQKADKFYRWVWDDREGYTTEKGPDAESYVTSLSL